MELFRFSLYPFAEFPYLAYVRFNVGFVLNTAKTEAAGGLYLHVAVEVLDRLYDLLAFVHTRAGAQSYGVSLFSAA